MNSKKTVKDCGNSEISIRIEVYMLKSNEDPYEHLLCGSFENEVKPMLFLSQKLIISQVRFLEYI